MGFQMLLTGNPSAAADNILDVFVTTARGQDFSTDGVSAFQFASKKVDIDGRNRGSVAD